MQTVLITGSSRGIGRAIALSFIGKNEYNVVINYLEQKDKAQEVVQILRDSGVNSIALQADVSVYKDVKKMHDKIREIFTPVDILINNAGIAQLALAQDISIEDWKHIFSVNVDGMFYNTKLVLENMISNKRGNIVNISSIWGQTGGSMETHYSATKGAIISYSKSLATELAPSNIRVNVVAPGGVLTDMTLPLGDEVLDAYASQVPMGRLAYPEEIAKAVEFLISKDSSYITGQVIAVNGGFYN